MCASKISRCLDICLTKTPCFLWAKLNTQDLKRIFRQKSHLLILKTNYWASVFSQESHPFRINIAFSGHISTLGSLLIGISYCRAVTFPTGLLLRGSTGWKREKLLQLAEICCPHYCSSLRSNGPPQCWPLESNTFAKHLILEIQDQKWPILRITLPKKPNPNLKPNPK